MNVQFILDFDPQDSALKLTTRPLKIVHRLGSVYNCNFFSFYNILRSHNYFYREFVTKTGNRTIPLATFDVGVRTKNMRV